MKRVTTGRGSRLGRYGALLLAASACESVLDLDRGRPAPDGASGGGGGGRGGKGGRGGRGGGAGDATTPASGGSSGDGVTNAAGTSASMGGTAGRGAAGASARGGQGGSSGTPSPGTGGDALAGESGQGGEAGGTNGECNEDLDCPNPDPDCAVQCKKSATGNTCVGLGAADRDGDEHGSAACEATPGDDCDDTRGDVYPNAPELCDARDNDCDGKRDFDDGLTLSRIPIPYADAPVYDFDLAWAPSQLTWGTVWQAASGTMYLPMDRAGQRRIEPVRVSDYVGTWGALGDTEDPPSRAVLPAGHTVSISWGEDAPGTGAFAVAFPDSGWDVLLGVVSADAASLVPAIPLTDTPNGWGSDTPDLAWLPAQKVWAASWDDLRDNTFQPIVRTVSLAGAYGPEVYPGFGFEPRLALAGGHLAAVWDGFDTARGGLFSDALASTPLDLSGSLTVDYPYIAGQTDRFGVVFTLAPDKIGYSEIGLDGARLCGPVLREADGLVYSDIMPFADGFLILSGYPKVQALEVLPGCRFGSTIELDTEPARFVRGANAREDGVVIAWGGPDQPLEMRVLGQYLCD